MRDFNYEKGGEYNGVYYPPLRPLKLAVRESYWPERGDAAYFVYEPGNATRYEVIFSRVETKYGVKHVMTLVNFRKAMEIGGPVSMVSLGYLREKLDINEGDCYALLPLINNYFEEN